MSFRQCRGELICGVGLAQFPTARHEILARVVQVLAKRGAGHVQLIRAWLAIWKNRCIAHFFTLRFLAFGGWCLTSKSSTASRISTERGIRVRVASSFKLSSLPASRFVSIPGRVVFPIWAYISLVTTPVKGGVGRGICSTRSTALSRGESQSSHLGGATMSGTDFIRCVAGNECIPFCGHSYREA